jgi:hypothetical protein
MSDYVTAKAGQAAYVARMREQGRKSFLDGPPKRAGNLRIQFPIRPGAFQHSGE